MTPGVVLFTAASGERSARLEGDRGDGVALFSAYDPRREAERFAAGALRGRRFSAVVVLGAGLGYLEGAASTAAPGALIFPVYYAAELAPAIASRDGASWNPAAGEALELFVERVLRDVDPRAVAVIEWPAAVQAFPELSRAARAAVLRVLKENAYGDLTVAASGRRWLRNTFANYLLLDRPLSGNPLDRSRPLVIAAAGPSLAGVLPLLARHRGRFTLWALASSLQSLRSSGLEPDLIVSSDPGYYASHLLSSAGGRIGLLAMPLSGARAAWRAADRVFFFAQPNFFELELFARSGVRVPAVDAHGTVAGTALLLARAFGAETVFFCGLDCCYDDIRSHAAPHPYDDLIARAASRLAPAYGLAFARAFAFAPRRLSTGLLRTSEALSVYAGSFREPCAMEGLRVFRLSPSPVEVPGTADADAAAFEREMRGRRARTETPALVPLGNYPGRGERRAIVLALLDEWLEGLKAGRPAPELVRFFGPAVVSGGGESDPLGATAGFLDSLRRRFTGDGGHA